MKAPENGKNEKTMNEKNLQSTCNNSYQKSYHQTSTDKSKKQRNINISTSPLQIRANKPLTPVRSNINSQGSTSMLATTPARGSNNTCNNSNNNATNKVREYRVSSASSNSSFQERQKKATAAGSSVSKIK